MFRRLLVLAALVAGLAAAPAAQTNSKQMDVLREAAAKGSAPAQYSLGTMAEKAGDFPTALRLYRQSANGGYAGAQYALALLLDAGIGTARDPLEAERLLQKAASANFEPAMRRLLLMEAARADASKATALTSLPSTTSAPGLLDRSTQLVFSGWGLGALVLLVAGGFFWWSREGHAAQTATGSHPSGRRHR